MKPTLTHCLRLLLLAGLCFPAPASLPVARNNPQAEAARPTPADVLRAAQTIFIQTKTVYFKPATLENALLQRTEFQDWGLVITREKTDADLIIEVDRKLFTTSFVYSVLDPRNNRVVASGRVNSIGGTVEGKISDSFIKRLRQVRASASSSQPR
ncbi:MAG TPA: hypothetical protein VGC64_04760 [Pyrinomonadaceae bacterium]